MEQQQGGTDFRVPLGLSWNMPKAEKEEYGKEYKVRDERGWIIYPVGRKRQAQIGEGSQVRRQGCLRIEKVPDGGQ